jgi:spore maturation protein CgeB
VTAVRVLFLESNPLWIHGLPNGFRDAGHEVMVSGPLTAEQLPAMIGSFRPDLVMTMGWTEEHTLAKQELIGRVVRAAGIPHAYWATEDPGYTLTFTLPYLYRVQPDFVFTIAANRVPYYQRFGIAAAYLDFGYHQSVHFPASTRSEVQHGVALVANAYPKLSLQFPRSFRWTQSYGVLIRPLLEAGIRIDLYGRHWDQMGPVLGTDLPSDWIHGYLPYEETVRVYHASAITIGIQNSPHRVSQRLYEILGSGGFLLTDDTPAVRERFTPGRELIVTSSPDQTVDLVRHYLAHPEERRPIQENAIRAAQNHRYQIRAESLMKALEEHGIFQGHRSSYDLEAIARELQADQDASRYRVQFGDTLYRLSRQFGVSVDNLKAWNSLTGDDLETGQILTVREGR